jgi:hypothetical protein
MDRVSCIEVTAPAVEIAGGKQDLGCLRFVWRQAFLIHLHEGVLADRGAGLELPQIGGATGQAQPADAGADGPGADQHNVFSGSSHVLQLIDQRLHALAVEPAIRRGQDIGSDLHNNGVSAKKNFLPNGVYHELFLF